METDFLVSGNHFLPLSQIFFTEFFIPDSGNTFFSTKDSEFLFRVFFPASGIHYLNYREACLKLLLLPFATILFDFQMFLSISAVFSSRRKVFVCEFSIPTNGNRFSVTVFFYLEIFFLLF